MAGLGSSCSHIAALLFKLEAAVHFKLNDQTACTSKLCSWKASRKHVNPSPLLAIDFSRPKKHSLPKHAKKRPQVTHYSCKDPSTGEDAISKQDLKELYKSAPEIVVFTSMATSQLRDEKVHEPFQITNSVTVNESETDTASETDETCIPEPLTSLFDPSTVNMNEYELLEHGKILYRQYCKSYNQQSYDNLCDITKKQALSNAWSIHRAGRITASIAHQVSRMQDSKSLISTIMQYKQPFKSKYTEHGKIMEPKAKEKFVLEQQPLHSNFEIEEVGLMVNAEIPCLGASPDGIVSCSCHGRGVLEIKCPYTYRERLDDWQQDRDFPIDGKLSMKRNHKYYYQIQMQMDMCKAKFGYFYVFSPGNNKALLSIVGLDLELITELKSTLLQKFHKFVLPEIVSRKMDNDIDNSRKNYCVCDRPEFGNMIACDNVSCKLEWFHYGCVNITRAPRGKWFCNDCSKKQ